MKPTSSHPRPLYVETHIRCSLDRLWTYTQSPKYHQAWDLRFSEIDYLPKLRPEDPQHFHYAKHLGAGIRIMGQGESMATKQRSDGAATSALSFWSEEPLSLIRSGSGYWTYQPDGTGIRFITGYTYETRWGRVGRVLDRFCFRPLMGWATAWSFDALKNWLEQDVHPRLALRSHLMVWVASLVLGLVWLWHGLVPKLLFPDTGELSLLTATGLFGGWESEALATIGIGEMAFGLLTMLVHRPWVWALHLVGALVLTLAALLGDASIFTYPFNPFSLNLLIIGVASLAWMAYPAVPQARRCLRASPPRMTAAPKPASTMAG